MKNIMRLALVLAAALPSSGCATSALLINAQLNPGPHNEELLLPGAVVLDAVTLPLQIFVVVVIATAS